MCVQCRAFITNSDRTCPYCGEKQGERAVDLRNPAAILGGFIPHARFITTIILVLNLGLFIASSVGAGSGLIDAGAKWGPAILQQHEWYRLITAGFFHGGILHILMNSWVLFDLGAQVEELYEAPRLIVFYILSTIGGFLLSTWWRPMTPSIGASAGLFGLIGAMIALGVRNQTSMGRAVRGMYIRWAIYGLLFGLLPGFAIDNAAHLGGLATGFGAAYIAGLPAHGRTTQEQVWRVLAGVCIAATALSFLQMFLLFRSGGGQ